MNNEPRHLCHICNRRFRWNVESVWYGSMRDEDELSQDEIMKACTTKCAKKLFSKIEGSKPKFEDIKYAD